MSHNSEIWIFEVIFVVFRLMKNIIFIKTERFVGRNTCDHACQIFCSKSNCETMYHWYFLLEITVVKIMNNLNACSAHNYLYARSWFKQFSIINDLKPFMLHENNILVIKYILVRYTLCVQVRNALSFIWYN